MTPFHVGTVKCTPPPPTHTHPPTHTLPFPLQAKFSDLDLRRNAVREEHETLTEKLNVLKANADKIDPNKTKETTTETVR